jgi:hypothetical protein
MKLTYRDFRPIRKGDAGWTEKKQKARTYYSPSTQQSIPLRTFQAGARGATYKEFVQQREKKGEKPKKYKIRVLEVTPVVHSAPTGRGRRRLIESPGKEYSKYIERSIFFKNKYARKISEDYGYELAWADMPDDEKKQFWDLYHEIVHQGPPAEEEYATTYEDYFGEYDDALNDIEYGDTP